ncbi:hypothetical protein DB88DRAFT_346374 [Papiliotrema laurentii]|uniref:DUF1275 domain protein n=1 Tax=Papiliotrema laurentii TaxID=5418 RepID=A0AAD9CZI9_PAPLA|nr:hypothetical protein DB88DRAFT_346374 [Papiliotrema laurentii]
MSEQAQSVGPGQSSETSQSSRSMIRGLERGADLAAKLLTPHRQPSYLTIFPEQPVDPPKSFFAKATAWVGDAGIDLDLALPPGRTWGQWSKEEIAGDALVLPLLIVTFSCAQVFDLSWRLFPDDSLADAITLQQFATFATSMTGNTVLLAIRLIDTTEKSPLYAGVSLLGFVIAGLVFGQLGAILGPRRRYWLLCSMITQIALLFINVLLVLPSSSPVLKPDGQLGWVYILLLAIQGGIQVTQAANAGARELPTAMMTTPYAALISDPALFSSGVTTDVTSRNRRFLYIVIFWLGAFVGAALSRWTGISTATSAVLACKVVALGLIALAQASDGADAGSGVQWYEGQESDEVDGHREPRVEQVVMERGTTPRRRIQSTPPASVRSTSGQRRRLSRDERNVAM